MIHYIIVKWKDGADKGRLSDEAETLFSNAVDVCGVKNVKVSKNIVDRKNRYDIMIAIEMERQSLENWDKSELHARWKEQYSEFIENKCIFDCE